jgi:hypothetical protein
MAAIWIESMGTYAAPNANVTTSNFYAEWHGPFYNDSIGGLSHSDVSTFQAGRFGTDTALNYNHTVNLGDDYTTRSFYTLPSNYGRLIGGFWIRANLSATTFGILLDQPGFGNPSIGLNVTSAGVLQLTAGGNLRSIPTTVLGSVAGITANSDHYVEYDITFGTASAFQVWLDGVSAFSGTGNTRGSSGVNTVGSIGVAMQRASSGSGGLIGHFYVFDSTGSVNNAVRGDSRVDVIPIVADHQKQWSVNYGSLGSDWWGNSSTVAPGANTLALRKFTTDTAGTMDSIWFWPSATSAGAKFKGVLYADNGSGTGVTGAPLGVGTELIGCVGGTPNQLLMPSVALNANTIYWFGYITDTSVALQENDNNNSGFKAANTYASGAPTSPALTSGQPSYNIFLRYINAGDNFAVVNNVPQNDDNGAIITPTVGSEDLYQLGALPTIPVSIGAVKLKARSRKTDAATHTIDVRVSSGGVDVAGSRSGFALITSYVSNYSLFDTDPATSAAWVYSNLINALPGVKLAS